MSQENDNEAMREDSPPVFDDDATQREIAELKTEMEAMRDRSLRALAEVENVRKRLERERDEARTYSVARFARDMLTVADNLARALAAFPPEARSSLDESVKAVLEGVDATERELQAALARHGVKPIDAKGQRFDPHLHQAIAEVPDQGVEPGTVVNVVQSGYMIGERLLRPAMVTVAKFQAARPDGPGPGPGETAQPGRTLDTKA